FGETSESVLWKVASEVINSTDTKPPLGSTRSLAFTPPTKSPAAATKTTNVRTDFSIARILRELAFLIECRVVTLSDFFMFVLSAPPTILPFLTDLRGVQSTSRRLLWRAVALGSLS